MKLNFFLITDIDLQSIRHPSILFLISVFEQGANWISKSMRNVIRWWGGVEKLAHLSSLPTHPPSPPLCFLLCFILLYSYQYAMRKPKGHDHDNLAKQYCCFRFFW